MTTTDIDVQIESAEDINVQIDDGEQINITFPESVALNRLLLGTPTDITGLLKGENSLVAMAIANTDYTTPAWVLSEITSAISTALEGYVPYTGATQDVNLGLYDLAVTDINMTGHLKAHYIYNQDTEVKIMCQDATSTSYGAYLQLLPGYASSYSGFKLSSNHYGGMMDSIDATIEGWCDPTAHAGYLSFKAAIITIRPTTVMNYGSCTVKLLSNSHYACGLVAYGTSTYPVQFPKSWEFDASYQNLTFYTYKEEQTLKITKESGNLDTIGIITAASQVATGTIKIKEHATTPVGYTSFTTGDQSGATLAYTLPTAYPTTNGYVLACTTAGVMSWIDNAAAGYVPYTGATSNVDLGNYSLSANHIHVDTGLTFKKGTGGDTAYYIYADLSTTMEHLYLGSGDQWDLSYIDIYDGKGGNEGWHQIELRVGSSYTWWGIQEHASIEPYGVIYGSANEYWFTPHAASGASSFPIIYIPDKSNYNRIELDHSADLYIRNSSNTQVLKITNSSGDINTSGSITATAFIIGANTLNTTEWAYLDGQDQSVFTTSSPQFANLKITGGGYIRPTADSTTALKIQDSAGTSNIITIDSTNRRIQISNVALETGTPSANAATITMQDAVWLFTRYCSGASGGHWNLRTAMGTQAAPTKMLVNGQMAGIGTGGYAGVAGAGGAFTSGGNRCFMGYWCGEDWNDHTHNGCYIVWGTTHLATGGSGSTHSHLVLTPAGTLWLGDFDNTPEVGVDFVDGIAKLHQDVGTGVATYHKFTAGTTTGRTATDGFDIGIDTSGNALICQWEALPLTFYTNGTTAMYFDSNQHAYFQQNVNVNKQLKILESAASPTGYSAFQGADQGGVNLTYTLPDAYPTVTGYVLTCTDAGIMSWIVIPSAAVTSVFSRTGDVVAETNDYTWAQIDKTTSDIADLTTKSHTSLSDIGTNTHADIDTHIADTSIHTEDNLLVHLAGIETITGKKTFDTELPESSLIPSGDADLVNKAYVDAFAQGMTPKASCRAATTTAGTLATDFENGDVIDDVTLATGDRILIKNQASAIENGIYVVAASGAPSRATDYDTDSEVVCGTFTYIIEGTANENTQWVQYAVAPEVGVDPLTFRQLPSPNVYSGSNGVQLVGIDFQAKVSDTDPNLEIADGGIRVQADGTTIVRDSGGLKVGAISDSNITGAIAESHGGTNLTSIGALNQVLGVNAAASALEYKTIAGGSNVTVNHTANLIEISATVTGSANYVYTQICFHSHISSSYTWTAMPAALTAISIYKRADLSGAVQYRICAHQAVAGYAGADLNLQYSTDGVNWYACDTGGAGELDVGTGTGLKTGPWATLVPGALQDVRLRLVGKEGNATAAPQWREIWVEIKSNGSVINLTANDLVDREITIHSHPASALTWTSMPAAVTEFISAYARQRADLSNAIQYRLYCVQSIAGFAGSDLNLQYSLDGTTWDSADVVAGAGELDVGTGTGTKIGAWATLKDAARGDVYLRLVGKDGNGTISPAWRAVKIQIRLAVEAFPTEQRFVGPTDAIYSKPDTDYLATVLTGFDSESFKMISSVQPNGGGTQHYYVDYATYLQDFHSWSTLESIKFTFKNLTADTNVTMYIVDTTGTLVYTSTPSAATDWTTLTINAADLAAGTWEAGKMMLVRIDVVNTNVTTQQSAYLEGVNFSWEKGV